VYDYRSADMELSVAELARAARGGAVAIARVPAAIVVSEAAMPYWRKYADLQSNSGFLRLVFMDQGAAMCWAADQAALLEAQARWFSRAQSPQ
jgi:hypothetical protein